MYSSFEIGNIKIGIGEEPLVIPEMGINAIALMCEDLAEKTGYGFAKFMAKYLPEKAYHSTTAWRRHTSL